MRYLSHAVGALLLTILFMTSCAKEETESYIDIEQKALDSWMKLYHSDLLGNKQADGNYYIDIETLGDVDDKAPIRDTIYWVRFDFSGRDLKGNICLTRNEDEAKLQGTFTRQTRYTPYFKYCGDLNVNLIEGTHLMMRNQLTLGEEYAAKKGWPTTVELHRGAKVTVYMPSSIVGGVSGDGGYEGQYTLSSSRPLVAKLEITELIKNPLEYEGTTVDNFAKANGTLRPVPEKEEKPKSAVEDDFDKYTWASAVDTIPQVYLYRKFFPSTRPDSLFKYTRPYTSNYAPYNNMTALDTEINKALLKRFGKGTLGTETQGDSIKLDGTAKIWYIGRFTDGFIFDTNIDEVKKLIYGKAASTGKAISYKAEDDMGSYITAWYYAIPQLRYGQWVTLITTSSYAYGSAGRNGSSSTSGGSTSGGYNDYYNYYNYYNNYYGDSYYNSYYNNYYGSYNNGYFGGYDTSVQETPTTTTVSTEVPSYEPLIFEMYIEPKSATE